MRQALRIIIFVIVMGSVSGTFLVGINAITSVQIAKNEEIKLKSSILDVLEITYVKEDVLNIFDENIKLIKKDKYAFYQAPDKSIAFEFYGPGLWGPIAGVLSVNADLKTIRTIKILHQEETPGLGARIAELAFLKQFKNKEFLPQIIFLPEGKAKENNQVDAITGATGSSKALEKLLNETLQKNISVLKG